jgi:hypothetical protein
MRWPFCLAAAAAASATAAASSRVGEGAGGPPEPSARVSRSEGRRQGAWQRRAWQAAAVAQRALVLAAAVARAGRAGRPRVWIGGEGGACGDRM